MGMKKNNRFLILRQKFPLTPALSRWERENYRQPVGEAEAMPDFERHSLLFPLLEGEGQGEGVF